MVLGHQILGKGNNHVVLLHDWFGVCCHCDKITPYLDLQTFTYALIDLRGYGKSKSITGRYTAEEASNDVLSTVNGLGWERFHLVGHSITGMIAQRMLVDAFDKVLSLVALAPIPAGGAPLPETFMVFIQDAAISDDSKAREIIRLMTGHRLSDAFVNSIVKNWREIATVEARIGYLLMFAKTNFVDLIKGLSTPMLVLAGAQDAPINRAETMRETFGQYYPHCTIEEIQNCGHFPLQEMPPLTITRIEKFLKTHAEALDTARA